MPQLSTTYDSKLKKKIFVLRGSEGYATTTDVVATLITDFDDYDTHISNCHVGLEIQVLREVGESTLLVIVNDEVISIPWKDSGMNELINTEYWNNQGIYWDNTNGKLLIGKDEGNITTGLFLLYDMDHIINVKYLGNKRCLGSSAKPIMFNIPTPTKFESTLTLHTDDARYGLSSDVDDITLLFECDNASEPKSIEIYDGETLLQTVNATKDVELTLDLSSEDLSTGSHTITALFRGDNESYRAETTLDISVGYNLVDAVYPSYVINGLDGKVSATVKDFFGNPWEDVTVKVAKYNSGTTAWTDISSTATSGTDGKITITDVAIDSNEYAITIGSWHDTKHTTSIIDPSAVTVNLSQSYIRKNTSIQVSGSVLVADTPIALQGIAVSLRFTQGTSSQTTTAYTDANGNYSISYSAGDYLTSITVTIVGTNITDSTQLYPLHYWWSISDNQQYGSPYSGGVVKTSNGFKVDNSVLFGCYTLDWVNFEFDIISIGSGDSVNSNSFSPNTHIKFEQTSSEDERYRVSYNIYVDGSLVGQGLHRKELFMDNRSGKFVFDNLKIYRG